MKSHLSLNFVFQFKSTSNHCSSQWIYEFIFSVSSCFLFTNTSHYTSTATRDSTVLSSWVCLLMRAFIVVANLCSTELLGFFFWNFTYYQIFIINVFLIWYTFHINKKKTFFIGHNFSRKTRLHFFLKDRYHMYYSLYTSKIKLN